MNDPHAYLIKEALGGAFLNKLKLPGLFTNALGKLRDAALHSGVDFGEGVVRTVGDTATTYAKHLAKLKADLRKRTPLK